MNSPKRSSNASSSRYVSWPPANNATGLPGDDRAVSLSMTARLKLMAGALLGSRTERAAHSSYRPGRKPAALWSFNPAGQDLRPERGGPGAGQVRRAGEPADQPGSLAAR